MSLTPNADDIWFWAMLVLNNKQIKVLKNNMKKLNLIKEAQASALFHLNVFDGQNDEQLAKVFGHYPQILDLLEKSRRRFSLKKFIYSKRKTKTHKILTICGLSFTRLRKKK